VNEAPVKVELPVKPRKTMVSSSEQESEQHPTTKSMAQSRRVDPDLQSNTAAKPGPSTLKRPIKLVDESGDNSGSEISVPIDAPKKKIKKGRKASEKNASEKNESKKKKKSKNAGPELSKHEETVKRLKSLVYACGVRKVWSKEFQNLDEPSEQIKRLKEILAELGMNGRPSLEKAKAIKERRDLEKELEDVRAFEQAVAGQSSADRRRAKSSKTKQSVDSDDEGTGSECSRLVPPNSRNAARRSIMAFLGDDGEDE